MGRLIDADELLKAMDTWDKFGNVPNRGLIPLRTTALQDIYVLYVKYDDMLKVVNGMSTVEAIPKANVYKAIQEMMKYEHEGFINISLARLDEILKKCEVSEDANNT